MFEAVTKDLVFTISLKRSTQNLQLSTSWAGRLHHLFGREWGGKCNLAGLAASGERPDVIYRLCETISLFPQNRTQRAKYDFSLFYPRTVSEMRTFGESFKFLLAS